MKIEYSIAIPLNCKTLEMAKDCQLRLHKLMKINSILKNRIDPHINFISGTTNNLNKILLILKNLKFKNKKNIDLFGLGIFLTPAPLLYMRFKKNLFVDEVRNILFKKTLFYWDTLSPTIQHDIWIPKSTVVSDLSAENLSKAIVCLKDINFNTEMIVNEFTVIEVNNGKEREITRIAI